MSLKTSYQIVVSWNAMNPTDTHLMETTEKVFGYVNRALQFGRSDVCRHLAGPPFEDWVA